MILKITSNTPYTDTIIEHVSNTTKHTTDIMSNSADMVLYSTLSLENKVFFVVAVCALILSIISLLLLLKFKWISTNNNSNNCDFQNSKDDKGHLINKDDSNGSSIKKITDSLLNNDTFIEKLSDKISDKNMPILLKNIEEQIMMCKDQLAVSSKVILTESKQSKKYASAVPIERQIFAVITDQPDVNTIYELVPLHNKSNEYEFEIYKNSKSKILTTKDLLYKACNYHGNGNKDVIFISKGIVENINNEWKITKKAEVKFE